jgi:parallel beta-helix repeat protein
MRTTVFAVITALTVAGWLGRPNAATWYIKPDGTGDAPTIMAAVESLMVAVKSTSSAPDTILLAPGTFSGLGNYEITNLGCPQLVFTSEAGPESTVIDCQGLGRGFTVPWDFIVISGITVQNGDALYDPGEDRGGGIYGGSVITNCILRNNHADDQGGGVYTFGTFSGNLVVNNTASFGAGIRFGGDAVVTDNTVTGNSALIGGGGIAGGATAPSAATVSHNRITLNSAGYEGGGFSGGGNLTFSDNLVTENHSEYSGGGMRVSYGATVSDNVIAHNTANHSGGGIYMVSEGRKPLVLRNKISENQAPQGAGIATSDQFYIRENEITHNIAAESGGGIFCGKGQGEIGRNTICENQAPQGAGVVMVQNFNSVLENNIVVLNAPGPGVECLVDTGWPAYFSCCNVYGNEGGNSLCGTDGGGNFSLDPQFCGIPGSGNYFLQSDSPCAPGNHPTGVNCGLIGALPVNCGTVETQTKTWGNIKSLYKRDD